MIPAARSPFTLAGVAGMLLLGPASVRASWLSPLVKSSQAFGSSPSGLTVVDDRAYLVTRHTLAVIDVSDPASMQLLAFDTTGGSTTDVVVRDGFAFLAEGIDVYDVRVPQPSNLPVVTSLPPVSGTPGSLGLAANFLFAHGYASPLLIYDVTDPLDPAGIGRTVISTDLGVSSHFYARSIRLEGDVLYLAGGDDDWGALQTFRFVADDPANPGSPTAEFLGELRVIDLPSPPTGAITAIEPAGPAAFAIDTGLGLVVLDVSDPATPTLHSVLRPNVTDIARSGNLLLATGTEPSLELYDISIPLNPVSRGSLTLPEPATHLAVAGDTAFLAGTELGLLSVALTDPPSVIGRFAMDGRRVRQVVPAGDLVYAVGHAGIDVYDAGDRSHPLVVHEGSGGGYDLLAIDAGLAAVRPESFDAIELYDLGPDGRSPSFLSRTNVRNLRGLVFTGGLIFAATRGKGLQILAASASGDLTERGAWGEDSEAWVERIAVSGSLAVVSLGSHPSGDPGFIVLNVSDPENPIQVGSWDLPAVRGIAMDGHLAYLVNPGSFTILDLANPSVPRVASTLPMPEATGLQIALAGGFAFVRTEFPFQRISVVDVLDPAAPFFVTEDAGIDEVHFLHAHAGALFVARDHLGLEILDLTLPTPQLDLSGDPPRLTWDAPESTRFPVESSADLMTWTPHGRLAETDLQPLLQSLPSSGSFLRARANQ